MYTNEKKKEDTKYLYVNGENKVPLGRDIQGLG